jgi:hypothetical protein
VNGTGRVRLPKLECDRRRIGGENTRDDHESLGTQAREEELLPKPHGHLLVSGLPPRRLPGVEEEAGATDRFEECRLVVRHTGDDLELVLEVVLVQQVVELGVGHEAEGDDEVTVEMESGRVIGSFPKRALRLLLEWTDLHHDELVTNWERARAHQHLHPIEPLP